MPYLPTLLIQIGIVIATARLFGWFFRKIHQPQVIGEMVAGIALGPSLLGWIAPAVSGKLFPPDSLGFLNALSQIGVLLFMFLIGMELDLNSLKKIGRSAVATSLAGVLVPFILGVAIALHLHSRLAEGNISAFKFSIFIGTAMSVTAFPVLARILVERNLFHTLVGRIAIASAAVADVMAWCILAFIIFLVRGQGLATGLAFTLIGLILFVAIMLLVIRPLLRKLEGVYIKRNAITQTVLAAILLFVLTSALLTEWLGIHALFGAFLAGAVMPRDKGFVQELSGKLEDITLVLLLPIFFAFTGLKTKVGLLSDAMIWGYCLLIIVAAILGKIGGAMLAARATGIPWREASAVGILLNTRGLVELIILNIGLEAGIISPTVFTIMVLMALVTTAITTPLLQFTGPDYAKVSRKVVAAQQVN